MRAVTLKRSGRGRTSASLLANSHATLLRFNVLERDAYPPGYMYFKKDARWTSMHTYKPKRSPVIVHANWVVGKNKKRQILQEKGLWKPTGKLLPCRVDQ